MINFMCSIVSPLTCGVDIDGDPVVIEHTHGWIVLDEVGQESVWIWAHLVDLCPYTEEEVVLGAAHWAATTHLRTEQRQRQQGQHDRCSYLNNLYVHI